MQWPDGFRWGTGASSTQREAAAPASGWWDRERAAYLERGLEVTRDLAREAAA